MEFPSIVLGSGTIFDGEKIGELTEFIINKFSEEGLNCDEAKIVLSQTMEVIGGYSTVQSLERKKS